MMDSIFKEEVRNGEVIVYMDNILIYAETLEDLERITKKVLKKC
jgi:hypothetical protein